MGDRMWCDSLREGRCFVCKESVTVPDLPETLKEVRFHQSCCRVLRTLRTCFSSTRMALLFIRMHAAQLRPLQTPSWQSTNLRLPFTQLRGGSAPSQAVWLLHSKQQLSTGQRRAHLRELDWRMMCSTSELAPKVRNAVAAHLGSVTHRANNNVADKAGDPGQEQHRSSQVSRANIE